MFDSNGTRILIVECNNKNMAKHIIPNSLYGSKIFWCIFFSMVVIAAFTIMMFPISKDFRKPFYHVRYLTSWGKKDRVLSWHHLNGVLLNDVTNDSAHWASLSFDKSQYLDLQQTLVLGDGYTTPTFQSANNDEYAVVGIRDSSSSIVQLFHKGGIVKELIFAGTLQSITYPIQYGNWQGEPTFAVLNNNSSLQMFQLSDTFEKPLHTLDAIKSNDETVFDYSITKSDLWVSITTATRSTLRVYSGEDKTPFKSWNESHTKGLWALTRDNKMVMFHPGKHSVSYHVKDKGWNILSELSWVRDPGNQSLLSTPCAGMDDEMNVICFLTVNADNTDGYAFWIHVTAQGFQSLFELRLGYVPVLRPYVTKVDNVYYTFINESLGTTHVYRSFH